MRTFHVKNFERFQHYKDRSPPWIKLYNALLDDYEFGHLPDASKMHLVAIWLIASRSDNQIPLDPEWIAQRINATDPVDLEALLDAGLIIEGKPEIKGRRKRDASKMRAKRLSREEGEKEKNKAEESGATAPASNEAYAFTGTYVGGITENTISQWLRAYSSFTRASLLAELARCDEYYETLPEGRPKPQNPYFTAKAWIERTHERATKPNLSPREKREAELEAEIYANVR